MKILLSKSQWKSIGVKAGWIKESNTFRKIVSSDIPDYLTSRDGEFYGLIDPNGNFYECGFTGHLELIAFFEKVNWRKLTTFDAIDRLGYVRVAINNKFSNYIEISGNRDTIDKYRDLLTSIQEQYSDWLLHRESNKVPS